MSLRKQITMPEVCTTMLAAQSDKEAWLQPVAEHQIHAIIIALVIARLAVKLADKKARGAN